MDRNLGATEAENSLAGRGLFYQWGRKDPFPGGKKGTAGFAELSKFYGMPDAGSTSTVTVSSDDNAGAIVESIQKPTTFYSRKNTTYRDWLPANDNNLWSTNGIASGSKTIYDPCPSGWRVPAFVKVTSAIASEDDSPWKEVADPTSWSQGSDTGGANWGANALFPAAGYRNGNSGSLSNGGSNGIYWSASPYTISNYEASNLFFSFTDIILRSFSRDRTFGFSVRCVKE
jgi:uncharacterized protein (TIGR02145 family)